VSGSGLGTTVEGLGLGAGSPRCSSLPCCPLWTWTTHKIARLQFFVFKMRGLDSLAKGLSSSNSQDDETWSFKIFHWNCSLRKGAFWRDIIILFGRKALSWWVRGTLQTWTWLQLTKWWYIRIEEQPADLLSNIHGGQWPQRKTDYQRPASEKGDSWGLWTLVL
jgi:hypothetical protein